MYIDPITKITGISRKYMEEINTQNMREFNMQCVNKKEIKVLCGK